MSWLDAFAYAELDRANGIRLPPTIATRRGCGVLACVAIRTPSAWARTREPHVQVCHYARCPGVRRACSTAWTTSVTTSYSFHESRDTAGMREMGHTAK